MMNSRDSVKPDLSRTPYTNVRERYFDTQSYQPQNPYDSPLPGNYYPYQPGYESEYGQQDANGRYGQATYHHHLYSTLGGGGDSASSWSGGGGDGGSWSGGGGHKSKNSALSMSALTLLAFLFFINMLQTCLKEQMTSLNPTVMVMTAGTSRFRKTGSAGSTFDSTKDLIQDDHSETGVISTSVSDNVDMITNDQGDIFFGPAPKTSFKVVDDTFGLRYADTTWEEIKQGT